MNRLLSIGFMSNKRMFFVFICIIALTLFSCGNTEEINNEPTSNVIPVEEQDNALNEEQESTLEDNKILTKFTVGFVTDIGGIDDGAFNKNVYLGLEKAKTLLDCEISFVESATEEDYFNNFLQMSNGSNDLVLGLGQSMLETMITVASQNPNQQYLIIDAIGENPSNLTSISFKDQEAAFLAGYVAGMMTETKNVGFLGGMKFPIIEKFEYGFRSGVKYANPEVVVQVIYAESFGDAELGKQLGQQMSESGADIIFHAAGGVGIGMISGAIENDYWAIGVDMDQSFLSPERVLTSVVKNYDGAVFYYIESMINEMKYDGQQQLYGVKENAVGLSDSTDHIPNEILQMLETVKEAISQQQIIVPVNEMEFNEF